MQEKGMRIICDRCGKTEFFKALKERELDGGYSRYTEFESHKEWGRESFSRNGGYYDLCPDCEKQYERIRQDFAKSCKEFIEVEKKKD